MRKRNRPRPKRSRLFLFMLGLPLAALGAVLLDWTLVAALFAGAWGVGFIWAMWDMAATDRKYGTWGSDDTLGP